MSVRRSALAAAVAPLLVLAMAGLVRAATLTVTNTNDPASPAANDGSLRGEILQNVADGGGDTIQFSVTGTIMLLTANGPLSFTKNATVTGPTGSPGISINGHGSVGVIGIAPGVTLNISNLIIENGSGAMGAGIYNTGTLTVSNCGFSGNTAREGGGIYNDGGGVMVMNSTFSNNVATSAPSDGAGGAIFNGGAMTVTDSTFSGNSTGNQAWGGAIFNEFGETLTVTNSTFLHNGMVADYGGGIFNSGTLNLADSTFRNNLAQAGAGLDNFGSATVTNCTFSANTATNYAGGIANVDTATITNCTLVGNSAGITGGGLFGVSMALKSTILSGESSGGNCGSGSATDNGYNISDDGSCGFTEAPSGTSVNNSTTLNLDPAGLHDNGGPTDTIALEPNSQAVDFIPVADCTDQSSKPQPLTTDQRGEPRPDPGDPNFCDAGAFELQTAGSFVLSAERLQIALGPTTNSDEVNMGLTFSDMPNPACDAADDVLNHGLTVQLFAGSCSDLIGTGLTLDLDPFVVHTVGGVSYGTLFQSMAPKTVSAQMVSLAAPAGACGKWTLNLELSGLDTTTLGLTANPFALILEDSDLHAYGCFPIDNAIIGTQIDPPKRTVRRGVRR